MASGSVLAPLGFGVAATVATLLGGLVGLRMANRVVLLLGLTAGVVVGVALFDLMPEALALDSAAGARSTLAWVAIGLGSYMAFGRVLGRAEGGGRWRSHLAPATLTLHSFMDGLGIGVAFQLSPQIGGAVAVAVLTHDLADGVNVVSICLAARRQRAARDWLFINGMAPLLGVVVGVLVNVPEALMVPLVGVFAGVFLCIGACELVPRSYALDPRLRTTAATLGGMVLMFLVTVLGQ